MNGLNLVVMLAELYWIPWAIMGTMAVVFLIWLAFNIARFSKKEKEEILIQFLIGLVIIAEAEIAGAEKNEWIEKQFRKTAPWFMKMLLKLTKSLKFGDLVNKASHRAKIVMEKTKTNTTEENK